MEDTNYYHVDVVYLKYGDEFTISISVQTEDEIEARTKLKLAKYFIDHHAFEIKRFRKYAHVVRGRYTFV